MTSIVAIFEKFAPAQSAKNELLVAGFSWRQVQLSPDHEVAPREHGPATEPDGRASAPTMGNLVRGLFGDGNRSAHGNLYGAAVRHGDYVLIADAEDERQRARAEDIMRRYQPVDLSIH